MSADSLRHPVPPEAADEARIVIRAEAMAVRNGLRTLLDTPILRALPEQARSVAQIVLAEALNNIVEHAYADGSGLIGITLRWQQGDLLCRIEDHGLPMPGEALPPGAAHALSATADLPEGGFGWHVIRVLARDLSYRRHDGRNSLSFRLDAPRSAS